MGCSTRPYNLMPPKRGPSNGQAQAGGCHCPGGGDPTSKASPLAQDASISNRAQTRAHHSLTPICPLELKGISKAERAGPAWPHRGWGMWYSEDSLPAQPTSCTPGLFPCPSLCSVGLVMSSGSFLHLLHYFLSRQWNLEGMGVFVVVPGSEANLGTLLATSAKVLAPASLVVVVVVEGGGSSF